MRRVGQRGVFSWLRCASGVDPFNRQGVQIRLTVDTAKLIKPCRCESQRPSLSLQTGFVWSLTREQLSNDRGRLWLLEISKCICLNQLPFLKFLTTSLTRISLKYCSGTAERSEKRATEAQPFGGYENILPYRHRCSDRCRRSRIASIPRYWARFDSVACAPSGKLRLDRANHGPTADLPRLRNQ